MLMPKYVNEIILCAHEVLSVEIDDYQWPD